MHHYIQLIGDWYGAHLQSGGYLLIVFLMALESSVVPIPSEVIIPPAAYLAYSSHTMSVPGVVFAGALGCVLGSAIMYVVSFLAGRPLVLKYGKIVWISPKDVEMAEVWTKRFGGFGVFLSRFVPVIRHLIGIPAGIVKMDTAKFLLYTFLGSGIWCSVLAWVGIVAGQDPNVRALDTKTMTLWVLGGCLVLGGIYFLFVWRMMRQKRS
jgi:membrane protein DedA with SNARE-associated domain